MQYHPFIRGSIQSVRVSEIILKQLPCVHIIAIVKRFDDGKVTVHADTAEVQCAHLGIITG